MNTENRCESPLGGHWAECDKFDKNGNHSVGIGKAVADVTYWNQSQGRDNEFTYQMCKECTECYSMMTEEWKGEDNVVIKIQYYNKKDKLKNFDNTRTVILID